MPAVTFSGLASGLDTGSLIDKLVAAERSSADTLAARQNNLATQRSIVGSLSTALAALGTAARGMDLASEVKPMGGTLSDATRVGAATSSSATAGVYDLRVKQLAQAQVTTSRTFATNAAGIVGDGGVTITVAGVDKAVSWTSADTLDTIAAKINDADAGVSASVLFDGSTYRLVTVANKTGAAGVPTFADSGDSLGFANPANIAVVGQSAIVSVNGIDVTRPTNVMSDVLAGVTLTLTAVHGVADPTTKLTVAPDTKAITDKVKGLIAAYNTVNNALHVQLDYNGSKKGGNTLFGDSMLRQLQQALAGVASNAYGTSNLGILGITRDKTGAMTLDESKLTAALATDANALSAVFVTNGFATAITGLTDTYTRAGDGFFATKATGLTDRSNVLQKQIDRINTNADALKVRLERQFAALEQAMSALQSQSAAFAAMMR